MTSFLFQAHPVSMVYAGPIFWDAKHAKAVMRAYRDFLPNAPEELGAFVGLKTVPSMDPFPQGALGQARLRGHRQLQRLGRGRREGDGPAARRLPPPIFNWMGEMPFPAMQALFDPFFPKGLQWYWKGDFVKSLPDEAIDAHIAQAAKAPSELSLMHLYPIDGAVRRVPEGRDRLERRDATWSMVIAGIDRRPGQADALKTWGPRLLGGGAPVQPRRGAYVNFMMDDEAG